MRRFPVVSQKHILGDIFRIILVFQINKSQTLDFVSVLVDCCFQIVACMQGFHIAIEPNNALFLETLGFAYVDLGNKLNDDAVYYDANEYAKAKVEIDKAYHNALPYFEKAYELEPDNYDYKRSLRSLYYRLGMNDKYEALAD